MVTQTQTPEKTIITTVQGVGKQQNGPGWVLTLAHTWPGSKYPTLLYGQDWEQIKNIGIGEGAIVVVQKGSLKQGKSPDQDFNYFWNLKSIVKQASSVTTSPLPAQQTPAETPSATHDPVQHQQPQDVTRISIERQKAVAEARAGAEFLIQLWNDRNAQLSGEHDRDAIPSFLETWVPIYEDLVSKLAGRFYKSIHGSGE